MFFGLLYWAVRFIIFPTIKIFYTVWFFRSLSTEWCFCCGLFGSINFLSMLKNKKQIGYALLIVLLLIVIRTFESTIFYDPFLEYFKKEYAHLPFPEIHTIKLFFSLGFRYYLNSMLSIALLYVLFNDRKFTKFSLLLYMILGSVLMISFFFVLEFFGEESKMTLFYIRRFIIQPILLLLFIPAFYYQKRIKSVN